MKKLLRFVIAIQFAIPFLTLAAPPASAHHDNIWANANCFDEYDVGAEYVGGSQWRRVEWDVDLTVNSSTEHIADTWEGVSQGFTIFERSGPPSDITVTGTVTMYSRSWHSGSTESQTYEKTGDFSDSRVSIDFQGGGDKVTIQGLNGWFVDDVDFKYAFGGWYDTGQDGDQTIDKFFDIHRVRVKVTKETSGYYTYNVVDLDTFNFSFVDQCVPDYQLNLSHIECVDGQVEVHFVLLNVPDGITPGTLTYTYGTIEPGAHTGNVWHYTDYLPDGYYNITSASVVVDGYTVQLHNPGDYAGDYNCSPDEASADVSVGACSWSEETGSQTPVSVTISGDASVTIQGPGGPYVLASSTTLTPPPGSYSWTAEAGEGSVLVGNDSGEFAVEDCTPPEGSVEVQLGVCQWTQQTGSVTPVSFTIDHATVTVNGPGGPYVLTSSTTLTLPPGSYSYSWEANEGYQGSGEGNFEVPDCSQTPTSVEVNVGSCVWDGEESTTPASFTLGEGVSVILVGEEGVVGTFDESTSFSLSPGYYYWEAVVDEGYYIVGASEGEFGVGSCEPGSASVIVTFGVCEFVEKTSVTEVTFTLSGDVTVTLTGPGGFELELTETIVLELSDGHYEWAAEANEGYELEGESSGEFDLTECEPPCETCDCPTCGDPIRETMGESMGIAWFSDVPCTTENCIVWYQEHNPWVKLWTMIKSYFTHEGETVMLQEVVNANGDVCYVQYFRDGQTIGDFTLWGQDGYGDRFRDHVPDSERALHKYSACSIFPSWCDTRLVDGVGYAVYLPGHTVSDWAQFLLDNGFFPDEEHRGTAALEWAYALRANGWDALMTWDGDLDNMPLFPLPPR